MPHNPVTIMGVVFHNDNYLALHRIPSRGGFWQPLTGTQEQGETDQETLFRELNEELNISSKDIDTIFFAEEHEFIDDKKRIHKERSYGVRVHHQFTPHLSDEHDQCAWVTKEEFLKLLKYPGNKTAVQTVSQLK